MTKKKEEFIPLEEGKVKMYVCGPTVYNFIHIGNARPMIVFDTVRRYFEYKGYDVNYRLDKYPDSLELAAIVVEPISGRVLKAYTTEPGMQFYIPNSNMDYLIGHGEKKYGRYYGFCLEMQHFPDAPNNPQFPATSLLPGEIYRQVTIYKFETISE